MTDNPRTCPFCGSDLWWGMRLDFAEPGWFHVKSLADVVVAWRHILICKRCPRDIAMEIPSG